MDARRRPPAEQRRRELSRIDLDTIGQVPGLAEAEFQRYSAEAKVNCPVSKALAGVPEITLSAGLE